MHTVPSVYSAFILIWGLKLSRMALFLLDIFPDFGRLHNLSTDHFTFLSFSLASPIGPSSTETFSSPGCQSPPLPADTPLSSAPRMRSQGLRFKPLRPSRQAAPLIFAFIHPTYLLTSLSLHSHIRSIIGYTWPPVDVSLSHSSQLRLQCSYPLSKLCTFLKNNTTWNEACLM